MYVFCWVTWFFFEFCTRVDYAGSTRQRDDALEWSDRNDGTSWGNKFTKNIFHWAAKKLPHFYAKSLLSIQIVQILTWLLLFVSSKSIFCHQITLTVQNGTEDLNVATSVFEKACTETTTSHDLQTWCKTYWRRDDGVECIVIFDFYIVSKLLFSSVAILIRSEFVFYILHQNLALTGKMAKEHADKCGVSW